MNAVQRGRGAHISLNVGKVSIDVIENIPIKYFHERVEHHSKEIVRKSSLYLKYISDKGKDIACIQRL